MVREYSYLYLEMKFFDVDNLFWNGSGRPLSY